MFKKIKLLDDQGFDERAWISKKITISDVAKVAGVSQGTVSRALNNKDEKIKISEKTKRKVLKVAKELGYKPNPFASALRTQKTGVIGAVIRDIDDPFLSQIIQEIQRAAHSKGIELLIGHAEYELEAAERQLNLMLNRWFDGLILLGNLSGDEIIFNNILSSNIPIVAIANGNDKNIASVNCDNIKGSKMALDYLSGLGHRRIAFIGNQDLEGVKQRRDVYIDFVKQNLLEYNESYIYSDIKIHTEVLKVTRNLLSLATPPTAIFCASDVLAMEVMSSLWQMGYKIPKDISVFGYDDIDEAADAYIPITTIRQPIEIIARSAFELLQRMTDQPNNRGAFQKIEIEPKLVVRKSCSTPPDLG